SSPFKVRSMSDIVPGKPALTDEAMGWLAYLNRRVDFGGTWYKDDAPHASWDNLTGAPIGNYYRYDLTYLTFAIGLMSDQPPTCRVAHNTTSHSRSPTTTRSTWSTTTSS